MCEIVEARPGFQPGFMLRKEQIWQTKKKVYVHLQVVGHQWSKAHSLMILIGFVPSLLTEDRPGHFKK